MGTRTGRMNWMAWQATLGGMADHQTRVRQRCPKCETWEPVDVADWLAYYGPDFTLVDYHPECDRCGGPLNFHASAGSATPFRPLFQ